MPIFKSTYNILKKPDEDEVFDENWMDSNKLFVPQNKEWDYSRELNIEDIDVWEVLYESGGGVGVYAAWLPYAEFYLLTTGPDLRNQWVGLLNGVEYSYNDKFYETYYGKNAQKDVMKRCNELGIFLPKHYIWVDNDKMDLYT